MFVRWWLKGMGKCTIFSSPALLYFNCKRVACIRHKSRSRLQAFRTLELTSVEFLNNFVMDVAARSAKTNASLATEIPEVHILILKPLKFSSTLPTIFVMLTWPLTLATLRPHVHVRVLMAIFSFWRMPLSIFRKVDYFTSLSSHYCARSSQNSIPQKVKISIKNYPRSRGS